MKYKDIKVEYLTPGYKVVEFNRVWNKSEVDWISQIFCELSDQFLNTDRTLISIFTPRVSGGYIGDGAFILKPQPGNGDYLFAGVQCCAEFFHDVSSEIKRISDIIDDFGYHLVYDVSNTRYGNGTYYTFKINFGKVSGKSNESKNVSDSTEDMVKSDIEWFKQIFARISDEIPNSTLEDFKFIPFIVNNNFKVLRYEMTMYVLSVRDSEFVREELESIKEILESNKYRMKYIESDAYTATHIRRFMQMSDGPGFSIAGKLSNFKVTIERGVKPKKVSGVRESISNNTNLLIVDVQKSFHKFFTEIYVHKLKEYASQFQNVYQVWDNHIDGKNVDKDFLYHEDPKIPLHDDLYHFPNQKDIIEKRYTYQVDANYFKKILSKETYQKIKSSKLKKGDYFPTKEGTIITYISNRHNFFHCPKKLYNLFKKLKGQQMTIVGGSDGECLEDIFTTAEALGVIVKRDHRFIWSASHCPIK